ncbi:unnamed protein product [Staurois parvus]|uniref:Uncharacterized protein n=1 Tax=Staurois parvus TaxID=386267 RepID=A0ABN9HGI7_9NEOB|nr:unnamed protein product [Staurois parvus]
MTRDCRQCRDDQRLRTQCRDDQRLRTVQEMTADLWGGGERVPEFDRYPLLLPQSFFFLSYLFLYPATRGLPGFCSVGACRTAGCPVRMREKRCAL